MSQQDAGFDDYPSRQVDGTPRKVLASVNGRPTILESQLEMQNGTSTIIVVYDSIGLSVFSHTIDLPKDHRMANEYITLQRNKDNLPLVVRINQLGENLTQGITRLFKEELLGKESTEAKFLAQQQIELEWGDKNRLQSVTTYGLEHHTQDKEIWSPQAVKTFTYDDEGRLLETTDEKFIDDVHYINSHTTFTHERVKGFNRVIRSWYTNNAGLDMKTRSKLELHTLHTFIYDPKTRARLASIGYANVELSPKNATNLSETIFLIKPEFRNTLIARNDDVTDLLKTNNVIGMRCVQQKVIPIELSVPLSIPQPTH